MEIDRRVRRRRRAVLALTLGILVVYLSPMLRTGFLHDDALTSTVRGVVGLRGHGFWHFAFHDLARSIHRSGRGLPLLFVFGYGTFYVVGTHVLLYKVWLLLLTVAAFLAFWGAARVLSVARGAAWPTLALLAAVPCLQLRTYHDSVVAYFGLLQVLIILLSIAIVLYAAHLRRNDVRPLIAAAAVFALACLVYEMVPLFAAVFVAVGLDHGKRVRDAIVRAWPLLAVAAVFVVVISVERSVATIPNAAYAVHLSPRAASAGFARQLAATIPLTFVLFDPLHQLPPFSMVVRHALPVGLVLAVSAVTAAWLLLADRGPSASSGDSPEPAHRPWWTLLAILLIPAAATCYVVKYQGEVRWGLGYIQVIVQALAMGGLIASLLTLRRSAVGRAGASVVLGMLVGLGYAANVATADVLVEVNRPRDAVERALHHGLLDRVPEHAAVRIAAGNWFTPAFVYMHTGRRVEARVGVPADYGGQPCREADAAKGGWADVAVVVDLQTSRVRLSCPTRP